MTKLKGFLTLLILTAGIPTFSQIEEPRKTFEIYGLVMTDVVYNFNQMNPDYFDVMRPTQLPSFKGEYGTDGNIYFGVRQSTFGVKSYTPTRIGQLNTIFEFDLYGLGKNVGQTALHFRKAWAEMGHFGVGLYWTLFCDFDLFPNSLDYWGPNGMALFPNIQVRWMPIVGETHLYIALERPGASADQGVYADRIELEDVKARFPAPDFTAEYRYAGKLGYVELAGLLRYISWEDLNDDTLDLSGQVLGWGLNLSSKVNFTEELIGHFCVVFGKGVENYMNDGPIDIGIENNFSDPVTPVKGVALPVLGFMAFLDEQWSDKFTSSIGYSFSGITNSNGQDPSAYKSGHYALANLLYYPVKNVMAGLEVQYCSRENYSDGWFTDMIKIQVSFRYKFIQEFYKKEKTDGI
jgi:hypothetical protein